MCERLRTDLAPSQKTIAMRRTLGGLLDLHLRNRHPEMLLQLQALGSMTLAADHETR